MTETVNLFEKTIERLKEKDLLFKKISSAGFVIYFLSKQSPGFQSKVYWKARHVLYKFQMRRKEYKKEKQILKTIESLESTNDDMVHTRGKILKVEEVERLLSLFAPDDIDYALMASVISIVLREIPKPAGLRIKAKSYLSEDTYNQLKEFII